MATVGASAIQLIDQMRANGADATADVAEVLARQSPVIRNASFVPCNDGTRHNHKIRVGLPTPAWGRLYKGIPQSKSGFTVVSDTTGFVESRSTVDKRELDIAPNPALLRMLEAEGHLEAMAQELETGVFYHDIVTTPEKFKGLAARYNQLPTAANQASNNVISAGGAGSDNTSIWIVTWSEKATFLINPKGTPAGIQREDMGLQRVTDANGDPYYVKEELFRCHIGVAVKDWRYNARVANIDVSDMLAGNVDLYKFLRQALYKLPSTFSTRMKGADGTFNANASIEGRTVIYMNRDVLQALDALGTNSGNAALMLKPDELEGRTVMTYRGIPIEVTDALLSTEAVVS
jgi:hypothetical protein